MNEGEKYLWVLGDWVTVKISSDQTGGDYSLVEVWSPPGGGPPPHIHHREHEMFHVLEGELTVTVGGVRTRLVPGKSAHAPKGVPHAFQNTGTSFARFLIAAIPGGLDRFLHEIGTPVAGVKIGARPVSAADIDLLNSVAPRYGIEMLPPSR